LLRILHWRRVSGQPDGVIWIYKKPFPVFLEEPIFPPPRKPTPSPRVPETDVILTSTQQRDSMVALTNAVDKANGYCFGSVDGATQSVFEVIAGPAPGRLEPLDIMERYNINDM
jgi:hypothetical protein